MEAGGGTRLVSLACWRSLVVTNEHVIDCGVGRGVEDCASNKS